jgi:transcriptional regulator of met regulon
LSPLALSDGVVTAWWIALAVLLVVAVVVTVLLEILRRTVHEVRHAVDGVLAAGGQLAQHTWTVQLLATTKDRALELVDELEREPKAVRAEGGPS